MIITLDLDLTKIMNLDPYQPKVMRILTPAADIVG